MYTIYNGKYPKALRAWAKKNKRTLESIAHEMNIHVNYLYHYGDTLGPKTIKKIMKLTNGEVTGKHLRPDLYGE